MRGTATIAVKTAGRVFRVAEYVGVFSHVSELSDPRNSNNTFAQNFVRAGSGIGVHFATVVGGGVGGAKVGAVIGSFICAGIGTVVGGIVGGLGNDQFIEKVKDGAQKVVKSIEDSIDSAVKTTRAVGKVSDKGINSVTEKIGSVFSWGT